MRLFKNLRTLLDIKRKTLAEGGDGLVGYQDSQARGYDRFVVRDWTSYWYISLMLFHQLLKIKLTSILLYSSCQVELTELLLANAPCSIFIALGHNLLELCLWDLQVLVKHLFHVLDCDEVSLSLIKYFKSVTGLLQLSTLVPAVWYGTL